MVKLFHLTTEAAWESIRTEGFHGGQHEGVWAICDEVWVNDHWQEPLAEIVAGRVELLPAKRGRPALVVVELDMPARLAFPYLKRDTLVTLAPDDPDFDPQVDLCDDNDLCPVDDMPDVWRDDIPERRPRSPADGSSSRRP